MDKNEIQNIERIVRAELPAKPWPFLSSGQVVEIASGPFQGILVSQKNERVPVSADDACLAASVRPAESAPRCNGLYAAVYEVTPGRQPLLLRRLHIDGGHRVANELQDNHANPFTVWRGDVKCNPTIEILSLSEHAISESSEWLTWVLGEFNPNRP